MNAAATPENSSEAAPDQPAWYEFLSYCQVTAFSGTAAMATWSVVRALQHHEGVVGPPAVALGLSPLLMLGTGAFESRFELGQNEAWLNIGLIPLALVFVGPWLAGFADAGYVVKGWPTIAGVLPFLAYNGRYRFWVHRERAQRPHNWQAVSQRVMRAEVTVLSALTVAALAWGASFGYDSLAVAAAALVLPAYALAASASWSFFRTEEKGRGDTRAEGTG